MPSARGPWLVLLVSLPFVAATVLAAVIVSPVDAPPEPAGGESPGAPDAGKPFTYVALGDSITRGQGVNGHGADADASWATGGSGNVTSIATRLPDHPAVAGRDVAAVNLAEGGARAADLPRQARLAAQADPDLVTVLVGANDACARGDGLADAFRADVRRAFTALADGAPRATVLVLGVPDAAGLVDAWGTDPGARGTWAAFGTCPAFLAPDASPGDVAAASGRVTTLNGILEAEAARAGFAFSLAPWEGNVTRGNVSTWDFFHPSEAGQARLAEAAWVDVARALDAA